MCSSFLTGKLCNIPSVLPQRVRPAGPVAAKNELSQDDERPVQLMSVLKGIPCVRMCTYVPSHVYIRSYVCICSIPYIQTCMCSVPCVCTCVCTLSHVYVYAYSRSQKKLPYRCRSTAVARHAVGEKKRHAHGDGTPYRFIM